MLVWDAATYVILGALFGLLIGFILTKRNQALFLHKMNEAKTRVETIENDAEKFVKSGYVSGFADCAKYIVLTHGQEFTTNQRADIIEKCRRMRETLGKERS